MKCPSKLSRIQNRDLKNKVKHPLRNNDLNKMHRYIFAKFERSYPVIVTIIHI